MVLRSFVSVVLIILLSHGFTVAASHPLAGTWEGEIEGPRGPIFIALQFTAEGARVSGTLSVLGNQVALPSVQVEGDAVRFSHQEGSRLFEGKLGAGKVTGVFWEGDDKLPFTMERLPDLPQPGNRVEAWEQDLDALVNRFLRRDRSFSAEAREEFRRRIAALRAELPHRSDPEVIVAMARAIALSDNAHTRLYLLRNRGELRRYPIRVWWFADGLYVVRATPEHQDLLACRVDRIGGQGIKQAKQAAAQMFAGNAQWQEYKTAYSLTSPEALAGLGIIGHEEMEAAPFAFTCDKRTAQRALRPLPLKKKTSPTEAWRDLSPAWRDPDFEQLRPALSSAPLYLRHPDRHYWFELLAQPRVLYLQYNRAEPMKDPSLSDFAEQLLAAFERSKPRAVVVDLRFNTGGNLNAAAELMEALREKAQAAGAPVYVITGKATFSAGITHVAQWRQWGATLVGEHPGDGLDSWSEGGNVVLPNSGLYAHFANSLHAYSTKEYPNITIYKDLHVESLDPDLTVRQTSREYFAGQDPELEAVLKVIAGGQTSEQR